MRGALTLNQSQIDKLKPTNLKSASIFSFQREIINMAYFTLPFPCEYVGACYGRSITPQPLSKAIEKTSKLEAPAGSPLGTRRCCDVEATLMTLIQRRINVMCPVGNAF